MPQLRNRVLELLDLQRARFGLALSGRSARFGNTQRLALREDHGMGSGEIRRKRINGARHALTESQSNSLVNREHASQHNYRTQPAACGRHVCCGSRQSIPSSR
jgi:hypothetical protein